MIAETSRTSVIVTTVDARTTTTSVRAMELGCDVITEKPMTTDAEKCQRSWTRAPRPDGAAG